MKPLKSLVRALRLRGRRLHRNEQGDEGVNKTLIIALIGVPLVAVLVAFASSAADWLKEKEKTASESQTTITEKYGIQK